MEETIYKIIGKHDTSTNWTINNPKLDLGEYGIEDDTHRVKRGDGIHNWEDLRYETFGLEYLFTFENITGEVSDNDALLQALDKKVDNENFYTLNSLVFNMNKIQEYKQNTAYRKNNFVFVEINNKTRLARVKENFISDNTKETVLESFNLDISKENLSVLEM